MSLTPSGRRPHAVTLQNPTTAPDGTGSFTETWATIARTRAAIESMSTRIRSGAGQVSPVPGTTISQASHFITIPYLSTVTTKSRVLCGAQVFHVLGVENPDQANRQLILDVIERVA